MKRFRFGFALFLALLVASPSFAAQAIGFVDVQRILSDSDAGRIARGLLEQSTKRIRTQLDTMRQQAEDLQAKYESQKSILKPDAREKLEQEIMEKQMELRQALQQSQMELQNRDAELTASILDELKPIIDKLAKERQLDVVMEKGEAGVLFAAERFDLTDVVLKRYDESKKKAPAPAAK